MALTDSEVQSLQFHMGYGNVDAGAYPYTHDGFQHVFFSVIQPNLDTSSETTGSTAVVAESTSTVTVADITGIVAGGRVIVDVGGDAEIVAVKSVSGLTFTATFAKAHPASGYPVAVMSGEARCRMLLHSADVAWQALQSEDITAASGVKKVDEIEFFGAYGQNGVLSGTAKHYLAIRQSLSSLVRVPLADADCGDGCTRLEAY